MSDYTKIVDYAAKDSLLTGNPSKIVKGTELGAEFDAIAVAVATKANSASPVFTGVSNFAAGTVGAPSIYLSTDTTTGWYRIGANNLGLAVSGVKVLDIASTGLAVTGTTSTTTGMAVGGATAGAGGIAFPATAVAVADANTLDDYEEGTFTPVINGTGVAGAGTYTTQSGKYTKIGRLVTFNIELVWTAHTGTVNMVVNGLPFVSAGSVPVTIYVDTTLTLPAGSIVQAYVGAGSATINLTSIATGGGTTASLALDTAAGILISGSYCV